MVAHSEADEVSQAYTGGLGTDAIEPGARLLPVQEQPDLVEEQRPGGLVFQHQVIGGRERNIAGPGNLGGRTWINLDLIWSAALVATGMLSLMP